MLRPALTGIVARFPARTVLVLVLHWHASLSAAQSVAAPQAAFTLASSEIFTGRSSPSISLTFRQLDHLDLRVYRVKDAAAFVAGLRDPHVLGSPEPVVPQEQTWIERIAAWKAARRERLRDFLRHQVSSAYRARRRAAADRAVIVQRHTVRYTQFAQVPLLNPSQLVASWRELLPRVRDAEARRIPLDLPGRGIYVVEAVHRHLRAYTVVVVSDLGLLTKTAPGQLLTFVARRDSGEPVAGCRLAGFADRARVVQGSSDADGVFVAALGVQKADALVTVAECPSDTVVADPGAWNLHAPARDFVAYLYTDRPVYRPGHAVHARAVLRWREAGLLRAFDRTDVEFVVTDSTERVLSREKRPVDVFGSASMTMSLPASTALGYCTIHVNAGDQQASGSFEVQEYRKPEFEVAVDSPERFVVQGATIPVRIRARYYFGQPVAGAALRYVVYRSSYYSPYRWAEDGDETDQFASAGYYGDQIAQATAKLDARGEATVGVPVPVDDDLRDLTLRIEARITDASDREVAASTSVHGTYGSFMLVPRLDRYLFLPGSPARLRVRALDYRGTPQPGVGITVVVERLVYAARRYDAPEVTRVTGGSVETGQDGQVEWRFSAPATPGDYRIRVTAPSGERTVAGEVGLWVPADRTAEDDAERTLELVLDRREYAPGDVAKVMLRGGVFSGAALVTKEREVTSYHEVIRIRAGEAFEVPVAADDVGDAWINVAFMKDDRLFRAEKRLVVPASGRRLQMSIAPEKPVARPQDPGRFTVRVADASGRPVHAALSIGVVDEALYGVRPDTTPDPLRFFYRREYSRVATQFSRDYGFVGYSGTERLLLAQRRRPLGLADFKAERPERPPVRREFPDAIYWIADLVTDAEGVASLTVKYPDALTTWRATARAVTVDAMVGAAVTRTTVTKDLILRLATPRFLTQGDRLRLPAIVNSYLDGPRSVELSVGATGLRLFDSPGQAERFDLAANGEATRHVSFDAPSAGTAKVTGTVATSDGRDALELRIPILPYGLKQERGVSGTLSGDGEQTIGLQVPEASNPDAREIRVALSPSLAGSMLGALDFLTDYPYGCTEQTLSSFLPNLLVLRTLQRTGVAPTERLGALDPMTRDGLKRLLDYQHEAGGWGWWKTDEDEPFMTAYALFGLLEAERAGIQVDRRRIARAASATARLYAKYPRAIPDLKAYLAWILTLAESRGVTVSGEASWSSAAAREELFTARGRMSDYGRALLLLALDAARDQRGNTVARELLAGARQQGDLAWWTSERDPLIDDVGDANLEATALAVKAIASREADDAILERAVRYLMVNRSGYYWSTTKQTATALYGLLEYLEARRESPENYTVEVSVNGSPVAARAIGRGDWTRTEPILVTARGRAGPNDVRIVKRGAGTLYWSATALYYDTSDSFVQRGSHELALNRRYFSLVPIRRDHRIVYRETPFDGTASPDDLLLVRLVAAGAGDLRYLVLDDPIPAGTEPVTNPEAYALERPNRWWRGNRREYRDSRVVFFQDRFDLGRAEYSYLLRVVTPGRFRAMPARISPMYVPDVSASSTGQGVVVADPNAPSTTTESGSER